MSMSFSWLRSLSFASICAILACSFFEELRADTAPVAVKAVYTPTEENVRYVGVVNCKNSFCHGGASPGTEFAFASNQYKTWTEKDFHSRSYSTLTTSESTRIYANLIALGNGDASKQTILPSQSTRCTTCHAPLFQPEKGSPVNDAVSLDLGPGVDPKEGVSCENCHNAAGFWLRGHTRADWSYSDRVKAGMNDLRDVYGRANSCVACHQAIDNDLVKAEHPELFFELDGQSASEPRHWVDKDAWMGPKAWIVGQAVALRQISQQLSMAKMPAAPRSNLNILNPISVDVDFMTVQQHALTWLLNQVHKVQMISTELQPGDELASQSDALAKQLSGVTWDASQTEQVLNGLAGTSGSFQKGDVSILEQSLRAERLVMALDRLFKALHKADYSATKEPPNYMYPMPTTDAPRPKGEAELTALFKAVQDRDNFDKGDFADLLHRFSDAISPNAK